MQYIHPPLEGTASHVSSIHEGSPTTQNNSRQQKKTVFKVSCRVKHSGHFAEKFPVDIKIKRLRSPVTSV